MALAARVMAAPPLSTRGMAALLAATSPEALQNLRRAFPRHLDVFDPAYVLGDQAPGRGPSVERMQAVQAIFLTALHAARSILPLVIQQLGDRIRRARRLRLAGSGLTAAAAFATAAFTALNWPTLQWASAALALFGSLLLLTGEHLERALTGGQQGLGELLSQALVVDAAIAELRLQHDAGLNADMTSLVDACRRANDAAARLRHVCVFAGLDETALRTAAAGASSIATARAVSGASA